MYIEQAIPLDPDFEWLDENGYPTEDALRYIKDWDWRDKPTSEYTALFDVIQSIWWSPEFGWHDEDVECEITNRTVRRYTLSTGGWSGNESLIEALQSNWIVWSVTWEQSRRGGHYIFEVKL